MHKTPALAVLAAVALAAGAAGAQTDRKIDFLKAATDFADCMIVHGRDRYGKVHSPLFAVLLMRRARPTIGPQPHFKRPSPYDTSTMNTPFRKYDFSQHYKKTL